MDTAVILTEEEYDTMVLTQGEYETIIAALKQELRSLQEQHERDLHNLKLDCVAMQKRINELEQRNIDVGTHFA